MLDPTIQGGIRLSATSSDTAAARSKAGPGPVLALLGGVLVLVSRFLEAGKVTDNSGASVTVKGNTAMLIAGVVLAVVGLLMWVVRSRAADILLGVLAILFGAFGALVAGALVSKDPIISTAADAVGLTEEKLKALISAGRAHASVGIGSWLALAGSILVILGGIANIVSARKASRAEAQPGAEIPPPPPAPAAPAL